MHRVSTIQRVSHARMCGRGLVETAEVLPRTQVIIRGDRRARFRVRAGELGDDTEDGSKLGDMFQRELEKRNISSIDDIQEDNTGTNTTNKKDISSYIPPPQFASGYAPQDEEDDGLGGDQLARSRRIGSEGLDGLIPRGSQLLTLGATSFLAFGPFILFVLVSFGAVYMVFGDFFVHSGTPATGPPVYYDPADLLAEPTADPMIPM